MATKQGNPMSAHTILPAVMMYGGIGRAVHLAGDWLRDGATLGAGVAAGPFVELAGRRSRSRSASWRSFCRKRWKAWLWRNPRASRNRGLADLFGVHVDHDDLHDDHLRGRAGRVGALLSQQARQGDLRSARSGTALDGSLSAPRHRRLPLAGLHERHDADDGSRLPRRHPRVWHVCRRPVGNILVCPGGRDCLGTPPGRSTSCNGEGGGSSWLPSASSPCRLSSPIPATTSVNCTS